MLGLEPGVPEFSCQCACWMGDSQVASLIVQHGGSVSGSWEDVQGAEGRRNGGRHAEGNATS